MLLAGETCRAKRGGKYNLAVCRAINKRGVTVEFSDGFRCTVPLDGASVWKCKAKPKQHRVPKAETYNPRKTVGRRVVAVVPTRFKMGETIGNFGAMLADPTIRDTSVCMFNDNLNQWQFAGLNPTLRQYAGGGNACARPYECQGHAIGMPTGPFGSLNEVHHVQFANEATCGWHTAQEIVHEAYNRVIRLLLDHPEKNTVFYSVNPTDPPGSTKIGLAIFADQVGADVVDEISSLIQKIPSGVQRARVSGVRP